MLWNKKDHTFKREVSDRLLLDESIMERALSYMVFDQDSLFQQLEGSDGDIKESADAIAAYVGIGLERMSPNDQENDVGARMLIICPDYFEQKASCLLYTSPSPRD